MQSFQGGEVFLLTKLAGAADALGPSTTRRVPNPEMDIPKSTPHSYYACAPSGHYWEFTKLLGSYTQKNTRTTKTKGSSILLVFKMSKLDKTDGIL